MRIIPGTGLSMWSSLPSFWHLPFRQEVVDVINSARSVAVNILGPKTEAERRLFLQEPEVVHRKDKFKAHKMLFVYGADTYSNDGIGFGVRWIVGVASFLLGNLSAPLTGSDLSLRRFAASEICRINNELQDLKQYPQYQKKSSFARAVEGMLEHEKRVFKIIRGNAEVTLMLRITMVVAAIASFAGAMLSAPDLLVGGTVILFASSSGMLIKTGFDSTAFQIRREASIMRGYLDYLLSANWFTGFSKSSYPMP
jgi:hypothetical protein